jgi:peptidoglycan/xylan/chitin deacetylase (PgdA/CDA1 family)
MKQITIILIIFSRFLFANEYYPEDRPYSSDDRGYTQYGTPSLHQTGTFALTYDDGPHEIHTPKLLDVLKEYQAKATFFIVTSRINAKTKPIIKRMIEEGHTIAAHTVNHYNSNKLTKEQFRLEIKQSIIDLQNTLKELNLKQKEIYFRFPYAAYGENPKYHQLNVMQEVSKELFKENCIQFVFWDIDSSDWVTGITSPEITQNMISNYEGGHYVTYSVNRGQILKRHTEISDPLKGGITLMHDIHERTIEATRGYLEFAKLNGLKMISVKETKENAVNPALSCKLN